MQGFRGCENRCMSEYESLRKDIAGLGGAVERAMDAQNRLTDAHGTEIERLWADNAALRDDVHAVANRLEALTRAITTSPADVAAAIVNDANRETLREVFTCRLNPGCNVSRPHIHDDDGAVIYVDNEATADDQLRQRAYMRAIHRSTSS